MIEAGIAQALDGVPSGSNQETWAKAIKAVLEDAKANGFVDPAPRTLVALSTLEKPQPQPQRIEVTKIYPEISLEEELERQRQIIVERIGKPLGISEADCLAQLPNRFPDRPETYDELRLTTPLIVPKFKDYPWLQHAEAAGLGITSYLRERIDELGVWNDKRKGVNPDPEVPFSAWFQDGSRYVGKSPTYTRGQMNQVERVGDHWGGIGLMTLRPDMVQTMWWDLIGGQVGRGGVPCAARWDDGLGFSDSLAGVAFPGFRSLVRGSEVVVALPLAA